MFLSVRCHVFLRLSSLELVLVVAAVRFFLSVSLSVCMLHCNYFTEIWLHTYCEWCVCARALMLAVFFASCTLREVHIYSYRMRAVILVWFFGCCDTVIRSRYVRLNAVQHTVTVTIAVVVVVVVDEERAREEEEFSFIPFGFVH